jgi:hypothetical protein
MRDHILQQLKRVSFSVISGKIASILHDGGTLVPQLSPFLRPSD